MYRFQSDTELQRIKATVFILIIILAAMADMIKVK